MTVNGGEGNDLFDDTEQTNGAVLCARTFTAAPATTSSAPASCRACPSEYIGGAGTDIASTTTS